MKNLFILIGICFVFTSCFQHWESPSSKLASQADTYLNNERISFFYGYCYRYGDAYNCLEDRDSLEDCQKLLSEAKAYAYKNRENAKRFISADKEYLSHLRKMSSFKPISEKEAIGFMKEGFKFTIDYFSDNYWSECREIADI